MLTKRILHTKWLMMIFMLGLFTPEYLKQFPLSDVILSGLKLIVSLVILMLFFVNSGRYLRKRFNILLIFLTIELLLSTLISDDASLHAWIAQMGTVVILCFFVEELMVEAPYNGLWCLYCYFSIVTIINTITIFLFPNAMYPNNGGVWVCWFLGEDNSGYIYYVIASTFAMLYCNYISGKITIIAIVDWLSAFIFVFHNDIATGIACQIIWLFLVIGYQFKWFKKFLKAQYALYIMLAGFVLLVVLRKFILTPVVVALGRDVTLTGRTRIWDRTIALIMKRPLLGYGIVEGDVYAGMIKLKGILMAHDWILSLGYAGGILAVFIYILQTFLACKEAKRLRTSAFYRYMVIGLIIVFIRAVTEGSYWPIYFVFPAMICCSKEFLDGVISDAVVRKKFFRYRLVYKSGGYRG